MIRLFMLATCPSARHSLENDSDILIGLLLGVRQVHWTLKMLRSSRREENDVRF